MPLGAMGTAEHYHVHLDIFVHGGPVSLPANVGVDQASGSMSYVHTHTPDGVVHIEAARARQLFTLGQLFTEWNVRLSATQVGGLKTSDGNNLAVYVNGKRAPVDPATLRLEPNQQIAIVYGSPDQQVVIPGKYDFAPGE